MSEGMPLLALVWGVAAGLLLLGWPRLLGVLAVRRASWLATVGLAAPAAAPQVVPEAAAEPAASNTIAAWFVMVLAASLLPIGNGWQAASLDAGLLWVVVLALVGVAVLPCRANPAVAGGVVTLTLCLAPLVVRTGSLHLGDLGIAQHGGLGNWYLVRDPFLLALATVALMAGAALWPDPAARPATWPGASLAAGLPLVLAHLLATAFLGAWWSFVPALDGLSWLNTAVKVVAVLLAMGWLRTRRPRWCAPALLVWRLPLVALLCCVGAVLWLVLSGAAS